MVGCPPASPYSVTSNVRPLRMTRLLTIFGRVYRAPELDHRTGGLGSGPSPRSLHAESLLLELARRQATRRRVNPLPAAHPVQGLSNSGTPHQDSDVP